MNKRRLVLYSPEIGNRYCEWFLSSHKIRHDRTGAVKVMVRRLNEYFVSQSYSLHEAKFMDSFSVDVEAVISSYLSFCSENGNKVTTQKRKDHSKTEIGKKIRDGSATLQELAGCAAQMKKPSDPGSGRQELLEQVMNEILFG